MPSALAKLKPSREFALLSGCAVAWLAAFLAFSHGGIEGDEAIVGLMATHIAHGQNFPVWFYGQEYMGSLEAFATAPWIWLLGTSPWAIKLTASCFALVWIWASWRLARRVFGPGSAALATALYLACGPLFLTLWATKLRGGFVSLWAIGTLVLLLAHLEGTEQPRPWRWLVMGVLAGLGAYLNLLVAPYLIAAFLFLLTRRRLFRPALVALGLGGFLAGAAPLLVYNFNHQWTTFRFLLGSDSSKGSALTHLSALLSRGLPVLLGASSPWKTRVDAPGLAPLAIGLLVLLGAGLVLLLVRHRSALWRFLTFSREPSSGAELYWLVGLGMVACFAFSKFGGEPEPRYSAVLYATIAPCIGLLLGTLLDGPLPAKIGGGLLGVLLLVNNAASIYRLDGRDVSQPFHYVEEGVRGPVDVARFTRELERAGADALQSDFWLGNAVAFCSGERVAASVPRWPSLTRRLDTARSPAILYRARNSDWERVHAAATDLKRDAKGRFWVWEEDGALALLRKDPGISPKPWKATASTPWAERAFDGSLTSGWTTEGPQHPGQWIEIDLGQEQSVSGLLLIFGEQNDPRHLVVEAGLDREKLEPLAEDEPLNVWFKDFPARKVRFLRFRQTGSHHRWWVIQELAVFP
ncbi:MAG TPA: glycosyltransferase family 39 protein [Myxococcales bacterium]|jgi:hypothetical protein